MNQINGAYQEYQYVVKNLAPPGFFDDIRFQGSIISLMISTYQFSYSQRERCVRLPQGFPSCCAGVTHELCVLDVVQDLTLHLCRHLKFKQKVSIQINHFYLSIYGTIYEKYISAYTANKYNQIMMELQPFIVLRTTIVLR